MTSPAQVKKVRKVEANSWLEITIREGRKHQVKRMLEVVGHPVIKLLRIRMGSISLGDLQPGEFRFLTDREANTLRRAGGRTGGVGRGTGGGYSFTAGKARGMGTSEKEQEPASARGLVVDTKASVT